MPKLFLCCLLVLLTPVDDAWARATPDPEDDARAAENNLYLPRTVDEPAPVSPAPGLPVAEPRPARPVACPAPVGRAVAPGFGAPPAPDRLYLLMSLQR